MNKEKLDYIIKLSELCGRWYQFFENLDWDHPNLLSFQAQFKKVKEKRDNLLAEFLVESNN